MIQFDWRMAETTMYRGSISLFFFYSFFGGDWESVRSFVNKLGKSIYMMMYKINGYFVNNVHIKNNSCKTLHYSRFGLSMILIYISIC